MKTFRPPHILKAFGLLLLSAVGAQAATTLSLSPASQTLPSTGTVAVAVRMNASGDQVNACDIIVQFPSALFDINPSDINGTGSAFGIEAQASTGTVNATTGFVRVVRGNIANVTGDQLIVTLTFRGKAAGSASVTFGNSVVLRSADQVNVVTGTTGGTYTLTSPDSTAPTLSSISHNVFRTSATVTFTTNEAATHAIDYGLTTSYGTTVSSAALITSHTQLITGLTAGTTYNYRIRATDAAGNQVTGSNRTMVTLPALDTTAPTISNIAVGNITQTGAIITWTTNEVSDSQVDYGVTSALGTSTTLDNNDVTGHSVAMTGLTANTTYFYRVKSRDPSGNLVQSSTASFRTLAVATPPSMTITAPADGSTVNGSVVNVSYTQTGNLSEVDHVHLQLDSNAEVRDLDNDGSYQFTGVTPGAHMIMGYLARADHSKINGTDAMVSFTVQAVSTTTATLSLVPATLTISSTATFNVAVRVNTNGMATNAVQFEVIYPSNRLQVTGVSGTGSAYGIEAENTTGTGFVRMARGNIATVTGDQLVATISFQGLSAGAANVVFISSKSAVLRASDSVNVLGATNGGSYTLTAGGDTTPPAITNVSASNISSVTARISWATNESADSLVEYGLTTAYGLSTSTDTTLLTSHVMNLANLQPNTMYNYRVRSRDAAGNVSFSANNTFMTLSAPAGDTTPPVISGVSVSGISQTGATVNFTTNEPASRLVEYGPTTSYGFSASNAGLSTSHAQALTGLTPGTTYNYRVRATDAANNASAFTANGTFVTSAAPIPAGVSMFLTPSAQTLLPNTTFSVAVRIDTKGALVNAVQAYVSFPTNLVQVLSVDGTGSAFAIEAENLVGAGFIRNARGNIANVSGDLLVATINLRSLTTAGTANLLFVSSQSMIMRSTDSINILQNVGNGAYTISGSTAPDTTPPAITNVSASNISSTTARINWTTNEAADSLVEFGLTAAYGQSSSTDTTMLTSHVMNLTGLQPGTVYNYRVRSRDAAGNRAFSSNGTFTTLGAGGGGDTTVPTVNITNPANGATVSGTVAINATAADNVGVTGVEFRVNNVVHSNDTSSPYSASWNTVGLPAGNYTLSAIARDAAGNTASHSITVTVQAPPTTPPSCLIRDYSPGKRYLRGRRLAVRVSIGNRTNPTGTLRLTFLSRTGAVYQTVMSTRVPQQNLFVGTLDTLRMAANDDELRIRAEYDDGMSASSEMTIFAANSLTLDGQAENATKTTVFTVPDTNFGDEDMSIRLPQSANVSQLGLQQVLSAAPAGGAPGALAPGDSPITQMTFTVPGRPNVLFNKPVPITLSYADGDGSADANNDGLPDGNGQEDTTGVNERDLRIFRQEGSNWRLIGGKPNEQANSVTAMVTSFSTFALMKGAGVSEAKAVQKFLSPVTQDGVNDHADFGLEAVEVEIMDVNGRRVFSATTAERSDSAISWNCRDEQGHMVPSGVYIAKVKKADGGMVYQSLVVAK